MYLPGLLLYPVTYNVLVSFKDMTLGAIISGHAPWVGLSNIRTVLHDPVLPLAFRNTAIFTAVSLSVQYVIGLGLALLFNGRFPLGRTLRALLLLPWLMPGIVATAAWRFMFDADHGVIDGVLQQAGVTSHPINWLTTPTLALVSVTVVNIWIGIAFNLVLLHSGLQGIGSELYEAAALDGAGAWRRFWHVTLPGLKGVSAILLVLGCVYTLKQFDIIYLLTGGGPGNASQVLSTYSYTLSFVDLRFGLGAAVGDMLFILSFAVAVAYAIGTRKRFL